MGDEIRGQMTIYDFLYPERIKPLREVARRAGPYWTTSRNDLIDLYETGPDIEAWTEAVRHEYSPYGYAGYYGGDDSPNTLQSYTMQTNDITITYLDTDGAKQTIIRSWKDFAEELAELIRSGEYKRREKDE